MPIIEDDEFGKITIRRSTKARSVKIRVAPDGLLRASLPLYAPLFMVKRLVRESRDELRSLIASQRPVLQLENGMRIGKSHTLIVHEHSLQSASVERHGQQIVVKLPPHVSLQDHAITTKIREVIIVALRIEAKSYLPKRLSFLANKYDYLYDKVRFSHASGRWGSCSSNGTISLNIALMKLPFELIDYVLLHELAHTRQMNHSDNFWQLVKSSDPLYKQHRRALKNETPSI